MAMKEHRAETLEKLLQWWPELQKLTEHTNVIGIRIVCKQKDKFGLGLEARAGFTFGEIEADCEMEIK